MRGAASRSWALVWAVWIGLCSGLILAGLGGALSSLIPPNAVWIPILAGSAALAVWRGWNLRSRALFTLSYVVLIGVMAIFVDLYIRARPGLAVGELVIPALAALPPAALSHRYLRGWAYDRHILGGGGPRAIAGLPPGPDGSGAALAGGRKAAPSDRLRLSTSFTARVRSDARVFAEQILADCPGALHVRVRAVSAQMPDLAHYTVFFVARPDEAAIALDAMNTWLYKYLRASDVREDAAQRHRSDN